MSLVENISPVYEDADKHRIEAIAETLLEQFYGKAKAEGVTESILELEHPQAQQCVRLAAVIVNYLREELE